MLVPRIGVLALQGDFALHLDVLTQIGCNGVRIRRADELNDLDGLILPGGESTTLYKLIVAEELHRPLLGFAKERPLLGTCAGAILMASELEDAGGVVPLATIDMTVRRNAYGRQIDSFRDSVVDGQKNGSPADGVFIRAPRIIKVGPEVEVLAEYGGAPVAVRSGPHVALTFHPELDGDDRWHRRWLQPVAIDPK